MWHMPRARRGPPPGEETGGRAQGDTLAYAGTGRHDAEEALALDLGGLVLRHLRQVGVEEPDRPGRGEFVAIGGRPYRLEAAAAKIVLLPREPDPAIGERQTMSSPSDAEVIGEFLPRLHRRYGASTSLH